MYIPQKNTKRDWPFFHKKYKQVEYCTQHKCVQQLCTLCVRVSCIVLLSLNCLCLCFIFLRQKKQWRITVSWIAKKEQTFDFGINVLINVYMYIIHANIWIIQIQMWSFELLIIQCVKFQYLKPNKESHVH